MNLTEGFLLLVIWVHGMAAVTWVGGGIFYIVAIRPQQKPPVDSGPIPTLESLSLFRSLVDICIIVLIVTGVILLFDKDFSILEFSGIFNEESININGKYLIILLFFLIVNLGSSLITVFEDVNMA